MVSYGDAGFREWADGLGLDNNDLKLIKSTAAKKTLMWFLIPQSISLIGLIPGQEAWVSLAQMLFVFFFLPSFCGAWLQYKIIKQGTFENVKPGIILGLFTLLRLISNIGVIPFIIQITFVKKGYASGLHGLLKKGKIGTPE